MLVGARNKKEDEATDRELTKQFHVLPLTMEIPQHFRSILSHDTITLGVHLADQLIAAAAMAQGCALLTLDQKHFKGIQGLKLA